MSGSGWGLVVAIVLGLVISEFSELSPWLAHKLIRWAAGVRYPTRGEELSALIAERPGKLFKLVTASGFACAALTYRVTHRKADPVRSVTSRLLIGLGSALVAGILMTGEMLLATLIAHSIYDSAPFSRVWSPDFIFLGAITAFATAAEFLVPSRLLAGWAFAVVSFTLVLIDSGGLHYWRFDVESLLLYGGMTAALGVGTACVIRLGNRLRFPVIAASSTILGCGLLTFIEIIIWSTNTPQYVAVPVLLLGLGFALSCSAGVGVLLRQVLCSRRLSLSSPSRTAT